MPGTNQQPTFEDLELLVEVSQLLTLRDLHDVMSQVIALAQAAVGANKSSLFLLEDKAVKWDYIFTARELDEMASIQVVSTVLDEGLAGWVVREKQGAFIEDADADDRWHNFPDDEVKVGSAICVPFVYDDSVIAVLTLSHPEKKRFNKYHLRLMTIVANQATVAIRNAQLFQRLAHSQQQLRAVLHAVPDVLIVTDSQQKIIIVNDRIREELQLGDDVPLIGSTLEDLAQHSEAVRQANERMGDNEPFEVYAPGDKRNYTATITEWEAEGKAGGAGNVLTMHDVTTLTDLYHFKDEMLRIISHDLRSPLAIVSGYADIIEQDATNDETRQFTQAILDAVDRINNLLEDLLKVRQIDEKGLKLDEDSVLADLVFAVEQGMRPLSFQKKQMLTIDNQLTEDVTATVDTVLLRLAMENLTSNAIKYSDEGGRVDVRAWVEDGRFNFEVEDDGIGIPEESIPHLFDSFYRVDANSNTTITGAGLGLSLVKSIVERHQGNLWVRSEEGVGSVFGLSVPLDLT